MPLYFRPRSKRPLSRRAQFTLAFAALALALGLATAWIMVSYYADQSRNPDADTSISSAPPTVAYTANDTGNLLMIVKDDTIENFLLVQAAPVEQRMTAVPLPPGLTADGRTTLATIFAKNGAAKAAALVSQALELPVSHYIQMTGNQTEEFLNHLGNGVSLTLPQAVEFTDENGAKLQLKTGAHSLTSTQAVSLLRYDGWKNQKDGQRIAADLVGAVLNAYVREGRYFHNDFAALANLCRTDLRIGDFTAWKDTLEYLATSNHGQLCSTATLAGETAKTGNFTPNIQKNRKTTPLY